VINRVLAVLAAAVFVTMLVAALWDVSQAWDVWYYHLPFAARIAGVVHENEFVFSAANQERFAGFTLLGEALQGALWRITGRPECANLVAFASVPLLAWFLAIRFRVPPHVSVLALFAIPLVHAHASSCYVDLPANAAASVLVLLAVEAWAFPASPSARTLAFACVVATLAANMRSLLHPIILVALAALALRTRSRRALLAMALALPIVFATPLKNLLVHGNPYFPVRLTIAGHTLPGPEGPYDSSPPWLEHAPRPLRFAASLFEIGIRPLTDPWRWTVDQWMPDADGSRMGGFFGAYVALNLVLLAWHAARDRSREVRVAWVGFLVFTALVSIMPQSHELRYYMSWMIVLVATNLWLACRAGHVRAIGIASAAALAVVLAVTRGVYAYPSGSTFSELVHASVDESALHDGDRLCVHKEPKNLLWAAPFHPPRRYVVKEAESAEDCGDFRRIE
jgi:hypothetical protein